MRDAPGDRLGTLLVVALGVAGVGIVCYEALRPKGALPPPPETHAAATAKGDEGPRDAGPGAADAAEPGLVIRGRVVDEQGRAVQEAGVLVGGPGLWPPREVGSRADGSFTVRGVHAADVDLWVRSEGRAASVLEGHEPGGDASLTVRVRPAPAVLGAVIDRRTGEAVPDARVALSPGWPFSLALRTVTDALGRFDLGAVAPGTYSLSITSALHVPTVGETVEVPSGAGAEDLDLEIGLSPGAAIAVSVEGPDGAPVEGALVSVLVTRADGERVTVNGRHRVLRDQLWALQTGEPESSVGRALPARAGEGGRIELGGVPAGTATVRASAPGWLSARVTDIALAEGQRVEVTARLGRGARVEGIVTGEMGQPLAGARVRFVGDPRSAKTTGEDGRYTLTAPPGQAEIEVRAPGHASVVRPVRLSGGRAALILDLSLAAAGASLEGWVVDTAGVEISGAVVRVRDRGGAHVQMATRTDGSFSATGLPPGPYSLTASRAGFAPTELKGVPGEEAVTVTMERGGSLEVEVLDGDLDPIRGARVTLRGPTLAAPGTVGPSGIVTFKTLASGTYAISVRAESMVAATRSSVAVVDETVTGPIRIVMDDAGALGGQVLSDEGVALKGVRVRVHVGKSSPREAKTDATGKFRVAGLPPGSAVLTATFPGWTSEPVEEAVVEGEDYSEVVITMDPVHADD